MQIHVVQQGETILTIAERYKIPVQKLILDNELINPAELVPGQTIVITYPSKTYIVQEGDDLFSIARMHNVSVMQLLRNNPVLAGRQYIFPGEELIISYDTHGSLQTYGFAYPFIDTEILRKTLPNLTYLSVINYRALHEGNITSVYDDRQIITMCKEYGTVPLLMITSLSECGEADPTIVYSLLSNEDYLNRHMEELLNAVKEKGYLGVNFVFTFMNTINQNLYNSLIKKAADIIGSEGYLIHVTINPNINTRDGKAVFEHIDYSEISKYADSVTFLQLLWSLHYGPPQPISNAAHLKSFVEYAINYVPPEKFALGKPILAYNWIIPYSPNNPTAFTLTVNSAISLAVDAKVDIQFDEQSQTPYFEYIQSPVGFPVKHIVWFIDARSLAALLDLIQEYNMVGAAAWNIMVYSAQLWLMINSEYDVIKLLPTI